jgi:tetratricopeptide (TPR) repeat protein
MTPQIENLFHELADFSLSQREHYYEQNDVAADVRRELERLFSFDKGTSDSSMREAIGQAAGRVAAEIEESIGIGSRVGPYRLLDVLGRGGMGAVYRAERADGEITQQVALKLVKGGMHSPSMLVRFRKERQILAKLEHPNIGRLLDGGTTASGVPYFVMEYIRGLPITEYCAVKKLGIRERLALFSIICDAVQYAHANLIIHRDLKPSNIMVTDDGTVKLLDFGIAKVLADDTGAEHAHTVTETHLFTPDYCSPEQIRGEPVSTATDVYALGCVLYELLTGKRPHNLSTYSTSELVAAICEREPARLSTASPPELQRTLRGDLETIVGRALMKDPSQRYRLVELLRRDVDSYLAGHPIMARPQTRLYRARKFIQRHRLAVGAAALATVLLVATTVVAVYQAVQARERFNQLRKIARTFIFEFNDELQRVPGNTKATALLVSTASEYLDNLARSAGNDRGLLLELAQAYERLATVQGASNINLNQRTAALESRRRAIDLRLQAARDDIEENTRLVIAAGRITNDLKDLGRLDEAVAAGMRAVDLRERLLKNAPTKSWPDLAMVHVFLARTLRRQGNLVEAFSQLEKADKLLAGGTGDSVGRLTLLAHWDRASLSAHLGMLEQAASTLQSIERDMPGVVAALPAGRSRESTLRLLPVTWAVLGEIHDNPFSPSLDDPVKALVYKEKVCGLWKEYLDRDPNDNHARSQVAACQSEIALTRMKVNPAEAVVEARRGVEIYEQSRTPGSPNDANIASNLAHSEIILAMALHAAGRAAEARTPAANAIQKFRGLAVAEKGNPEFSALLMRALVVRASIESSLSNPEEARRAASEAAQLGSPLAGSLDLAIRRSVADAYNVNAEVASSPAERCQWRQKVLTVWESWTANDSAWVASQKQDAARKLAGSSCSGS